MTPRAYSAWVIGGVVAVLTPVLLLNMLLISNDYRFDKNRMASEWQQETGGITYAPPVSQNRSFKTLRLNGRIPEINTVVFGSSTAMGITADAFPGDLRMYNFSQSGNSLLSVIGEARDVLERWGDRLRVLLIPLDWSLGFVYQPGMVVTADLAASNVVPAAPPPLRARLRDALSWPRVRDLILIFRDMARAPSLENAIQQFFSMPASTPYRCADGTLARDFDTLFRGQCVGFRSDGSATFADQKRVTPGAAPALLAKAASASSQYSASLERTNGEPSMEILAQLVKLNSTAREKSVSVIFYLPPLLPGLDDRLSGSLHSGEKLRKTKSALQAWARMHRLKLVDAGPSERFGCLETEFIDPHHALPGCYRKVMAGIFSNASRQAGDGK